MKLSLWEAWRDHCLHDKLQPSQGISQFLVTQWKQRDSLWDPIFCFGKTTTFVTWISFAGYEYSLCPLFGYSLIYSGIVFTQIIVTFQTSCICCLLPLRIFHFPSITTCNWQQISRKEVYSLVQLKLQCLFKLAMHEWFVRLFLKVTSYLERSLK